MAFDPITDEEIEVGKPIKKELLAKIQGDLDDLDERIQTLGEGSGTIDLINETFVIGKGIDTYDGVLFVEVFQDCILTEGAIQFFAKSPSTSGTLSVDVKKNTTTNPSGFNSIFSTQPSLSIATDPDYQRSVGIIDASAQVLNVGDILRVDVTSLPDKLSSFRFILKGEY